MLDGGCRDADESVIAKCVCSGILHQVGARHFLSSGWGNSLVRQSWIGKCWHFLREVLGVTCTNALELGIDIGRRSAVLVS